MNTLLPFPSFNSIGLLSNADLGVQIYEAAELVHLFQDCPAGWHKNPAVLQWYGYLEALKDYYNNCILHWANRGFNQDRKRLETDLRYSTKLPPWVGDPRIHAFHRATLLKRNPNFYSRYAWKDRLDIAEIYPNMHDFGVKMREHLQPAYAPPVEFNWSKFFRSFHT